MTLALDYGLLREETERMEESFRLEEEEILRPAWKLACNHIEQNVRTQFPGAEIWLEAQMLDGQPIVDARPGLRWSVFVRTGEGKFEIVVYSNFVDELARILTGDRWEEFVRRRARLRAMIAAKKLEYAVAVARQTTEEGWGSIFLVAEKGIKRA